VQCHIDWTTIYYIFAISEISMFNSKPKWLLILISPLIMLAGCGSSSGFPKTYKVSGTVKQSGKPVDGAMVTFLSDEGTKAAVGSTNANGEFKLSTFGPGDGALPGSYKVTITKLSVPAASAAPSLPPGVLASGDISDSYEPPSGNEGSRGSGTSKNLLPAKYASETSSGLIATVAPNDTNKFDFEL
jgi:hypothetical protein